MTPTQALNHLACVLFDLAGNDEKGRKVAVRLGYGNRLKVPAGLDQGNCGSEMAGGFISLWLTGSDVDCKSGGFQECEGEVVDISEVVYETRITVHAQRCGSFDRLHNIKGDFCHHNHGVELHADIFETPTFGTILDVSAIADGDEFEDRAEMTMTVKHRDRTAKRLNCVTLCMEEIMKHATELEALNGCQ